ncbi:radical SAM/SPASM domain-containing protein [Bacillus testis]|uniref:radical SAM/SPASM domain-containing protein n=1 Tax=Bacillus testis TaxID=1622072 RepID=UPI00067EBF04|nr:radical SAM/SPASM domain-containing protein [Bacillus testis]
MKKFKKVYVEITNICNLKCNFCPSATLMRTRKLMDHEHFTHIINEVKEYTDHVYFHLMGEPFLNKNIGDFLDISAENGLKVNITTNGTIIAKVKERLLSKKALRQVNISLHSFEANEFHKDLDTYISDIADFINEAQATTNVISAIRLWNMDTAELKACNELNDDILSMLEEKLGLDIRLSEQLQHTNNIKLKDRVYLNMAEKFEWPDMDRDVIDENIFCYALRDQIGILVDGTVVPCCLDSEGHIGLGNIFESPLEDILSGERARNMYDGFSRRCAVEDLCKRCGYAKRHKK